MDRANEYIFFCLLKYQISCLFSYSSIALACLLVVLEDLNFLNFAEGILSIVNGYEISFELERVGECKELIRYFQQEQNSEP